MHVETHAAKILTWLIFNPHAENEVQHTSTEVHMHEKKNLKFKKKTAKSTDVRTPSMTEK